MEIDIRDEKLDLVDTVRFAQCGLLQKLNSGDVFVTTHTSLDAESIEISNEDDAYHLIKALKKVIELGWFDK
jgi:hypothetical protein